MNVGTLPLYTHMSMQPDTTSLDTHLGDSHKCVTSDASTSTEKGNFDKLTNELINLAPYVMEEMSESDVGADVLVQFFKLVVEKKFPLSNTSFLLWCDVVKWYNCKTAVNMRYSEQTKLFWKLRWRLFGGRFIHFMSGYKNQGDKVKHGLSTYIPEQSEINFAVPDENILRYYDPYRVNGEREPGIFEDIISVLGKNLVKKSSCLTYDGKKLKQGLSKGSGDVDLMGFEEGESLKEKREHLLKRETSINEIMTSIGLYEGNIQNLPELLKAELKEVLLHALKELSINIFQLKEIKTKKEYCKAKLIERGGDTDWRKGRYVYAISAVIAFIYDIDNFLSAGRELTQTLSIFISYINGVEQIKGSSINLETSPLHQCLDDVSFSNTGENSRYLKQKSDEWFALRKKARITGSTFYSAVGCDGLNRQKDHFEKVICGIEGKEPSDFTKKAMQHGTDSWNTTSRVTSRPQIL
ncbi:unnamed protein product [Mytilus edulis]|uniref:Uncharacterized protein n=1 Tax=Mytilus edulis TaxID=6550 RepID=A0A8S3VQA8_MYTED|nr:unnamed protein product [Mytilus edulis]